MPVAEQVRVSPHTGNGSSTNFAYSFKIFTDEELLVVVDDVVMTLTTDYTVNGAGDPTGGSIDFVVAPINLSVVTLSGDLDYKRDTDFIENGGMRSGTVDDDLDKLTILTQQLRRDVKRSIKVPIEETSDQEVSLTPTERALKVMSFDAAGDPTAQSIADLSSILSSVDASLDLTSEVLSVAIPNRQGVAGGTVDAITTTTSPTVAALANHVAIIVQAAGANTVVDPTFAPDGLTAKDIVKGNNQPLLIGDIPGINYRMHLVYSAVLDKWILLNPYGVTDPAEKSGVQSGGYLYAAGAGLVNVMTAAFTPTLLVLTTGMRLRVKVNLANTIVAPTLNPDTLGAKTIVHKDGSAMAVGDLPINHLAEFIYDGTNMVYQNPVMQVVGVSGVSRGLVIQNNSGTPNTQVDVDADEILLGDSAGRALLAMAVNLTINTATTGLNGMDTGALGDGLNYVWMVSNGTTTGAVISASASSPTMPDSTYTFKALMGGIAVASSVILGFIQKGKLFRFNNGLAIQSDNSFTTSTWTSFSLSTYCPPIAEYVSLTLGALNGTSLGLAPFSSGEGGDI